jgi:hypothetical protein
VSTPDRSSIAAAVAGRLVGTEPVTASSLFASIGGVRGVIESMAPGFLFLIVFTATGSLVPSVVAPVAVAIGILLARLLQRLPVLPAVSGGLGILLSAGFALFTGRAEDNFVGGFITNGVWLLLMLGSLLVRKPLIGFIARFLIHEGNAPTERRVVRAGYIATAMWGCFFALRLLIQVPLWLAGATTALAATKLIMGLPMYAALIWVTWLMMRSAVANSAQRA